MKVVTVIGARPQFIKAAAVTRAIADYNHHQTDESSTMREVIVHTGQHFDKNMSEVFFRELELPEPYYHLDVHGLSHGAMTGKMLERIEAVLVEEKPDVVMVYGDTNSTLAGALAAVKLHIPVAHVEAGLRSFNRRMPEEINRILTDHVSTLLFCPTDTAVANLGREGVEAGVYQVGDVMYDSALFYSELAEGKSTIVERLGLQPKAYGLVTIHREENTEDLITFGDILRGLAAVSEELPLIWPMHPRNRKYIGQVGVDMDRARFVIIDPVGYLDFVRLEKNAEVIFTDSGGVQKEAYFYTTPCITLRGETEWIETLEGGMNRIAGTVSESILKSYRDVKVKKPSLSRLAFGDGSAANRIVRKLVNGRTP